MVTHRVAASVEHDVNQDALVFLDELVRKLLRQKKAADAFGETKIAITWKNGNPSLIRVTDEATHKFDTDKGAGGTTPSRD